MASASATPGAVTPHRDEAEATAGLLQDRCEALLLLGPQSPVAALARLAERLPVVVLARPVRHAALDVVRTADADGVRQAVDHLAGLGHRRIAHIDGGRAPGADERRRGYRAAMHAHGLDEFVHIVPGGLTESDGVAAAPRLEGVSTAVTVFNDRCATGVLDVLARGGVRVPGEMSVVGYDDSHLARLAHVDLTTIARDTAELAALAVARAVARIDGHPVARREQIVPPHLITRGTTGRP